MLLPLPPPSEEGITAIQKLYRERFQMEITEEKAADILTRIMNFLWAITPEADSNTQMETKQK